LHGIAKCVRAALQILPTLQAGELGMLDAPHGGEKLPCPGVGQDIL
jgi:hypothetical protein